MRYGFSVIVLGVLTGCATHPLQGARFWAIDTCAEAFAPRVNFQGPDGNILATVPREYCSSTKRAAAKIGYQTGFPVDNLYIASTQSLNAFATHDKNGKRIVIVTMGMLQTLGHDEAAWAGLFGHEIAHHMKRHGEGRAEAKAGAQASGQAIGNVIAQLVPGIGGFVAGNAANFVVTNAMYGAYTRPQEAEADELGLRSMVAAGYDPRGMQRLFDLLRKEASLPAFLSTHPGAEDRMQVVERFIATGASGRNTSSQTSRSAGSERIGGQSLPPLAGIPNPVVEIIRNVVFHEFGGGVYVRSIEKFANTTLMPRDLLLRCPDGTAILNMKIFRTCIENNRDAVLEIQVERNSAAVYQRLGLPSTN